MCGRYTRRAAAKVIYDHFGIDPDREFSDIRLAPSYNICPQSFQPVVRLDPETAMRELSILRWGLIPAWAKDSKIAYRTINARAETVATSAAYRDAFQRRRCLVPADLFYEWKQTDARSKEPYAIALRDRALFAFAGLWERWRDRKTEQILETYSIITTQPNEVTRPIHDRMPVIVDPANYERWLGPGDPGRLPVDLLCPYDADRMTSWRVSAEVGNVRNNHPGLCEPVS